MITHSLTQQQLLQLVKDHHQERGWSVIGVQLEVVTDPGSGEPGEITASINCDGYERPGTDQDWKNLHY